MKILHLQLDKSYEIGDDIRLPKEESHHCRHVLRLAPATVLKISDGREWFYEGEFYGDSVTVTQRTPIPEVLQSLHLHVALLSKPLSEELLRRATELGVSAIHWTLYERSEPAWRYESVVERWEKLLREAVKASGRERVPRLYAPCPLSEQLSMLRRGVHLVGCLDKARARDLVASQLINASEVHVWIGPTGDFSDAELDCLLKANAIAVSLGRYIYRVEVAALIFIVKVQALLAGL